MTTPADNVLPLIPMTARQLALMPPEEQRDYWIAVANVWTRNVEARQREHQADCDTAIRDDDWVLT